MRDVLPNLIGTDHLTILRAMLSALHSHHFQLFPVAVSVLPFLFLNFVVCSGRDRLTLQMFSQVRLVLTSSFQPSPAFSWLSSLLPALSSSFLPPFLSLPSCPLPKSPIGYQLWIIISDAGTEVKKKYAFHSRSSPFS